MSRTHGQPNQSHITPPVRARRASVSGERPAPGVFSRVLGVPSLVLLGLVYMVPLTVFTTYGIVTNLTGGRLPAAYALTLVAMLFTARSYGRMARDFPTSGSAYAYSTRTFGPIIGFLTGWSLMLDYLLLPMINYLVIGIYLHAALPAVPAWVFVLTSIVLVSVLNLTGITTIARANWVIVILQGLFLGVFVVLAISSINATGVVDVLAPVLGAAGADPSASGLAPLFAGAAILCLSFLGFDAVSTFAEEATNARRTVPRAIMLTTLIAGALFIGVALLGHLVLPVTSFANPDAAALEIMMKAGGQFLSVFFVAAFVAGSLGSALTSQASVSRILYSMGRDGVLPKRVFGTLSATRGTPTGAVIATSLVSLLALIIDLTTVSSLISFGALVAFSAVNLTVVKHIIIDQKQRGWSAFLSGAVLPLCGFGTTIWLWTSLSPLSLTVGLAWAGVGVICLAAVTRVFTRPVPQLHVDHAG